jgi:uncharacterized protein (TIGR00255 family)
MLRSMTGFGSGEAAVDPTTKVRVELRSVNHRFLDVRARVAPSLSSKVHAIEELVRARAVRGRLDVTARLEGPLASGIRLDRERAASAYRELTALRDELAPGEPVPLTLLASVPDLFVIASGDDSEALDGAIAAATHAALDALDAMRETEGRALEREVAARLALIATIVPTVEERSSKSAADHRTKLKTRVDALLAASRSDATLEPSRVEQEIALLADRLDVTEEIARLGSHLRQAEELVTREREPVGRRLDFLLQELLRETNTIGSKSADSTIAQSVVQLKAELERIREQIQNVL